MGDGGKTWEAEKDQVVVEIDIDRYTHYLDDTDMSEDDKRVFLETLGQILIQFVDLGFDIHGAGAVDNSIPELAKAAPDAVHSDQAEQSEEWVR